MSKAENIEKVGTALSGTVLDTGVVYNPFPGVNKLGKPAYVPMKVVTPTTLTTVADREYFEFGNKILTQKQKYSASCEDFSCAVATLLAKPLSGLLRKSGTTVELVGYKDRVLVTTETGEKKEKVSVSGHVLLVVGRGGAGSIADPATWGEGFAVDQWWACQQSDNRDPIKDPDATGTHYDKEYFDFLAPKQLEVIRTFTTT
jgi:hypothetical protein